MNTTELKPEANETPDADNQTRPQPLCRPIQDRMLAGVAAGIARYLGVDVTVVRIVFAVLAVVGGAGVPIYIAGWLLIPEEGSEHSIASQFIQSRQARAH
jgi:phage shock protein C